MYAPRVNFDVTLYYKRHGQTPPPSGEVGEWGFRWQKPRGRGEGTLCVRGTWREAKAAVLAATGEKLLVELVTWPKLNVLAPSHALPLVGGSGGDGGDGFKLANLPYPKVLASKVA